MNCKPGDLAIVINARYPETMQNIGRIVEVGYAASHPDGAGWVVVAGGALLMTRRAGESSFAIVLDSDLLPVGGHSPEVSPKIEASA